MKQIYKYPLDLIGIQGIYLPLHSKILCVKEQYNNIVLYAEIDTAVNGEEFVEFVIVGTGHQLPTTNMKYIDTVLINQDTLVWHVYKVL